MLRHTLSSVTVVFLLATAGVAQQAPTPKPQEKPAEQPRRPEPPPQVNVRIELTITDQTGPGEPSKKVVTMLVADRNNSSIRTSGWIFTRGERRDVSINVDARPIVRDGAVQIDLGVQYQPVGSGPARPVGGTGGATEPEIDRAQTSLNERISTIMESGKTLLISQAADPTSDRRISVEVKATIVK